MTKQELNKIMRSQLRARGFRSFGTAFVLKEAVVTYLAKYYWHRFAPQLLLEIGFIVNEVWQDQVPHDLSLSAIDWDVWVRYDSYVKSSTDRLDVATVLDLESSIDDSMRIVLLDSGLNIVFSQILEPLSIKENLIEYVQDYDGCGCVRISPKMVEHIRSRN